MSYAKLKDTPFQSGVDYLDRTALFERMRLNDIAHAFKVFNLGGSLHVGIDGTSLQDAIDYQEVELDGVLLAGFVIRWRVKMRTEDAATSVRPLVWDDTTGAELATAGGSATVSTNWVRQDLTLTLPAATRRYWLRFEKSNDLNQVWGKAYMEFKAP